jgi:ATP-dependent Clp protease ATP-binding subunit ClpB
MVTGHFRPEFLNRVDEIVVFHPLGREHLRKVTDIQIGRLRERLRDLDMQLDVSPAALDRIADAGFDPVYGARPLKRAIQQLLENPLSQAILAGRFSAGDTIRIECAEGELTFERPASLAA